MSPPGRPEFTGHALLDLVFGVIRFPLADLCVVGIVDFNAHRLEARGPADGVGQVFDIHLPHGRFLRKGKLSGRQGRPRAQRREQNRHCQDDPKFPLHALSPPFCAYIIITSMITGSTGWASQKAKACSAPERAQPAHSPCSFCTWISKELRDTYWSSTTRLGFICKRTASRAE